jgi:hypothetical protein
MSFLAFQEEMSQTTFTLCPASPTKKLLIKLLTKLLQLSPSHFPCLPLDATPLSST